MAQRLIPMAVFLAGSISIPAWGEMLPDPTRPAAEAEMLAGGMAAPIVGPVLQSVIMSAGRRNAVISGQLLSEGERFGEASLIRISENEVELSGPEGKQILKLFPAVEKLPVEKKETLHLPPEKTGNPRKSESKVKAP
ncbi:MAG: hypothetical protein Q8O37_00215 [Sulfuricellaceae bacterium]|nr:hypothetical protein [Sulfuricellaceae bacterium]